MSYSVSDIKTLEGIAAIRLRPGMYIGSVGIDGVHHITLEIISNVIDEYLNGYCSEARIVLGKDGSIIIGDNGRGVPVGIREDGTESLEAVFTKLHTGAKFDSDGKTGYNTSGGMNGVGAKATNALSEYFIATVYRDRKKHTMEFRKGIRVSYKIVDSDSDKTGTIIQFKPDKDIFKETIKIDVDRLRNQLIELSFLSKGLSFTFIPDMDKPAEIIKSENGLLDYLDYLNGSHKKITSKFYSSTTEGKLGVEVSLMYNETYSETTMLYTNNIPNPDGGTHMTGFRTALTRAVNEYARDKKLIKDKDNNLTGDDLKEGLVMVLSLKMPDPIFEGQTKNKLSSAEGRGIVERLVSKEIRVWLESNPDDAKAIINKALITRKAREAAKRAREATRKKASSVINSVLPGKLADCQSKIVEDCEIYLVEGDSAAGTAKEARDRATQAILPLRGKVLNVLKADLAKCLANEEIKAMITAFGLQSVDGKVIVDEDKLRYDKIIIMTDADVDGSHIRILLLTFLWKFAKELILSGHVYAAMPPLYKVVRGNSSQYLLDDKALEEYKRKNPNAKIEVSRFKGLGELNAEQLEETTMSKENRVLKRITVEDIIEVEKVVQNLMGEAVAPRKEFIKANAIKTKIEV